MTTYFHTCSAPNCNAKAELLPQLFVPASNLSSGKFDGCSSTMGFPVCKLHFHKLAPSDFLRSDEVRASISADFREFRAMPDWDNAKIYPLRPSEPAFKVWEEMNARANPN
jgi:hypothetical protein